MEIDNIKSIFKNQNDIMKTEEIYKNGMTKYVLSKLIKSNVLEEKVSNSLQQLDTVINYDIKLELFMSFDPSGNFKEKIMIKTIESQNGGIDIPTYVRNPMILSAILFFFNPAHKPSGIAKIKDIANAVPINISVAGRRSPIISVTGLLFFNEIPRSP